MMIKPISLMKHFDSQSFHKSCNNKIKIMSKVSIQSKGKLLLSLMKKKGVSQKDNPEMISSTHYTNRLHQNEEVTSENDSMRERYDSHCKVDLQLLQEEQINNRNEAILERNLQHLAKIYVQLYGEDDYQQMIADLQSQNTSRRNLQLKIQQLMLDSISNEILRLQQIQSDQIKYHKLLEKSTKGGTNEQKWKIIVLNYREKLQRYQNKLEEEKRMKYLIQKELDARIEEIERLSNMNHLKFQKLNAAMQEIDIKTIEAKDMNHAINEMELNLSSMKINVERVSETLAVTERQKQRLAQQLIEVTQSFNEMSQSLLMEREKSFLHERQKYNEGVSASLNVLERQDEEINRQIADLKEKYEYQIMQLELKLRDYHIENEMLQLKLLELQHHTPLSMVECEDVNTQTQENVVKAYYYSSLEDDLQDERSPQDAGNNDEYQQDDQQLGEFQLSINPNSINSHAIYTPRQIGHYSDVDPEENNYYEQSHNDVSFEQGNSMSNAPSRYMETMEQLTAELAQAYERINEMTSRISLLQDENKKFKTKGVSESSNNKLMGGYLTNFFKK